jgi:hypothetical protein
MQYNGRTAIVTSTDDHRFQQIRGDHPVTGPQARVYGHPIPLAFIFSPGLLGFSSDTIWLEGTIKTTTHCFSNSGC